MLRLKDKGKDTRPGVIDTLSAGFFAINRQLWIILLPIAIDILIWRGPQLSALPVLRRLLDWYQAELAVGEAALPLLQNLAEARQAVEPVVEGFNLLSLLVLNFVASLPNSTVGRPSEASLVVPVTSGATFAALFVVLELVGLALGCFYLGLIAQQVRDGRVNLPKLLGRLLRSTATVLALALLGLAAILAITVPVTVLAVVGSLLGNGIWQALLMVASTALYFAALWALIFLFFTVDAIVVSELGVRRAVLSSVQLVGKNFRAALGLIFLTILILSGTQIIWSGLGDSPWGIMAGVVGNAYIASGLTAASMVFYVARVAGTNNNDDNQQLIRR